MDSPRWGTTYVGGGRYRRRDFAAFRACGDPAAMLTTDLLAERSFPCGARARSTSSRRRANRRPPGPGTPESRERGNASAGEGRIGCAMTRATQCAAVPTDCGRARTTSTAAAPHVGATPHVLPHVRPLSRSLAPSERSSPDEPRQPRRGRQCRDNQRRPTVAGHITLEGGTAPESDGAAARSASTPGTPAGTGAPRRRRSRGGRGRSRSGAGAGSRGSAGSDGAGDHDGTAVRPASDGARRRERRRAEAPAGRNPAGVLR